MNTRKGPMFANNSIKRTQGNPHLQCYHHISIGGPFWGSWARLGPPGQASATKHCMGCNHGWLPPERVHGAGVMVLHFARDTVQVLLP